MIGVGILPEKTRLSWYQSIAKKKYLWIHVIFDGGLSIPFTRKSGSKRNGTFSKWRDLKKLKI
jgi:hypothetical protein